MRLWVVSTVVHLHCLPAIASPSTLPASTGCAASSCRSIIPYIAKLQMIRPAHNLDWGALAELRDAVGRMLCARLQAPALDMSA